MCIFLSGNEVFIVGFLLYFLVFGVVMWFGLRLLVMGVVRFVGECVCVVSVVDL